MEAVILVGLQGAGKSTFYRARFSATHARINLDTLRTRHRELVVLRSCIEGQQSFVVDNTNPTPEARARYIAPARAAGYRVVGYYFDVPLALCLARVAARPPGERVPPVGLYGTRKRLRPPAPAEGFDALYRVRPGAGDDWLVEEWEGKE